MARLKKGKRKKRIKKVKIATQSKARKRTRKKKKQGLIKKSIAKILVTLLIVSLNWTGLLAIGRTFAYFNDIENSPENIYQAATLDFVLETPGDFSLNFKADEIVVRGINVINEGSLLFKYIIGGADFSGPLCEKINLEATLDGEIKYDGALTNFVLDPPVIFSEPSNWEFIFSFSGDIETYKNTPCQFFLDFKGWQDNAADYDSSGFNDLERALVRLTLRQEKTIVLNEFLPNPEEDECNREGILGEWVEIHNNGSEAIDLTGWYIQDGDLIDILITTTNTLAGTTIIGSKGSHAEWLVVFLNDCVLDNDGGDSVSLYNPGGELMDSYDYSGFAPENKSYARYPDGTGPWYDPIPTPGGPNKIDETDFKEQIEQIEEIEPENDLPEISIIDTATPSDQETIVEETIIEEELIEEELIEEEVIIEEDQEQGGIIEEINEEVFEVSIDESLVVEEQPAIEEQPADVSDNDSGQSDDSGNETGETGSPADTISE